MPFKKHTEKFFPGIILILLTTGFLANPSYATPEYAEKTAQGCKICHLSEEGDELTETGIEYSASGYVWPPKGGYRVFGPIRKTARLIIGALHMLASFMWFGTILYVHILLKPKYAERGLPRGEVGLGMASMAVVGITGILLTISRINSIDVLFTTKWGTVLSVKILLFITMISSALFVVFYLGPRLKKGIKKTAAPEIKIFDPLTLASFDGKEGKPAFIAYKGKVYDVTGLKLWKHGNHAKHSAGRDLTGAIAKSPHGEEKLDALKVAGVYDAALSPPKSSEQKVFYFIAYMNLVLVFCVLFTIAYWRWGL